MDPIVVGILGSCLLFVFLLNWYTHSILFNACGISWYYLSGLNKRCTSDGCQDGL